MAGSTLRSAVELLDALESRQLTVHYQAVFGLPDLRLDGFEALVRWRHPERGLLLPGQFLPLDMDGGLGWALTNFVLEESIRACAGWQRAGVDAGVSVNISPGRFVDEVLPSQLLELLDRHGVASKWLTVEVTEARCGLDPAGMAAALAALSQQGVRISLDDFGTGESTLQRLRSQRFDEIKIDRCFIADVATDPTDRNIVNFATSLAHSLGINVVAEGVETAEQLATVVELGVDLVQGFHLHRPHALEEDFAVGLQRAI